MSTLEEHRPRNSHKVGFLNTLVGISPFLIFAMLATYWTTAAIVGSQPASVDVNYKVTTPYGGVFNEDCTLKKDGSSFLDPNVIARQTSGDKRTSETVVVPSAKFEPTSQGECATFLKLHLQRGKTYALYNSGKRIGILTQREISNNFGDGGSVVRVYRNLNVTLTLEERYDRCEGTDSNWTCWYNNSYSFAIKTNQKTGTCSGQNAYSDIKNGAKVRAEGLSSSVSAAGTLKQIGDYYLDSVKQRHLFCEFQATIKNVPNDDSGYTLFTGIRGGPDFTLEYLRGNNWNAGLSLKAF